MLPCERYLGLELHFIFSYLLVDLPNLHVCWYFHLFYQRYLASVLWMMHTAKSFPSLSGRFFHYIHIDRWAVGFFVGDSSAWIAFVGFN